MTSRHKAAPESPDIRRDIMASLGQSSLREFHVAFSLMSLIPLCIGVYVLAARFFTIDIFEGLTGVYFLIAIILALLGFFLGRRMLRAVLDRLIDTSVQLRQHEVMKSLFIANVAYELRPPLAAVQMSLKNLTDGLLGRLEGSQQATIQECHQIIERLARLTTDLINMTDLGGGTPGLTQEVFEVQDAVREVIQANEPYLHAHRLTVSAILPDQPVLFFGDRRKLLQCMGALIDHAVRWSPEGGTVGIEASFLPQEWRLIVSHGIASSSADFSRALDAFTRLGGRTEESLGLGLHVARDLIQQHHGRFWVEGEPQNSRLIISLPVLQPASKA